MAPVSLIAPFPAFAPSDDVAALLQSAGIGALIGTALAAVFCRHEEATDTWFLTAAFTLLGPAIGLVLVAGHRLGWW